MNKKERLVAAIEQGTVIDHIPATKTYQVANLLGLFDLKTPVTIGNNYPSQKVGNKGIIKVSDKFFTDGEICVSPSWPRKLSSTSSVTTRSLRRRPSRPLRRSKAS